MADAAISANRLELLQIADAVAREKSIERSVVLAAMEDEHHAMSEALVQTGGAMTRLALTGSGIY